MAHPFASVRQHKVEQSRLSAIVGRSTPVDAPVNTGSIKQKVKASAAKGGGKIDGKMAGGRLDRYARGGKVKKAATTVNVIVAPQGPKPPLPIPAMPGAGPAPMPVPPPVAPPMGAMPPGGAQPLPMGPRRNGGRAYAAGGSVKAEGMRNGTAVQHTDGKNDQAGLGRGKPVTYANGGGVPAPAPTPDQARDFLRNQVGDYFADRYSDDRAVAHAQNYNWKPTKATGGKVEAGSGMGPPMRAGDNGVGRLQKTAMQKRAK